MTDILQSPSQYPSNSSSISPTTTSDDGFHQQTLINRSTVELHSRNRRIRQIQQVVEREEGDQLSVLAVVLTVVRKSLVGCKISTSGENCGVEEKLMEIGCPTNVRHVAHVTFDRFNGFLGLPVEFEPEVPRRPPSASTRVFGVSTDSMQLSFDARGNCVPTILLMMQHRLYLQNGLQYEGIFRINPENGQEEYVREQLNNGVIPENIDVHCLAGLIKAWFRELPNGILDSLPSDQVMEAQAEDECSRLVGLLPPTEGALLDWAVNLMADVAQFEQFNKMNARNIAMVFAPNMTQMSDPLTALMYAVQVMNFLRTLIEKTLRAREGCLDESDQMLHLEPSDEDGHCTKPTNHVEANEESKEVEAEEPPLLNKNGSSIPREDESRIGNEPHCLLTPIENILLDGKRSIDDSAIDIPNSLGTMKDILEGGNTIRRTQVRNRREKAANKVNEAKKGLRKRIVRTSICADETIEKTKDINELSRVNSLVEKVPEPWR